jgi:hypothetical protein
MTRQKRVSKFELVARVRSQSKPGKVYEVKRNKETGNLGCNCPDFIFRGRIEGQNCKHINRVLDKGLSLMAAAREIATETQGRL